VCLLCFYVVLSCVGRGLCDGLITRPEESYRVSNCVLLRNLKREGQGPIWAVSHRKEGNIINYGLRNRLQIKDKKFILCVTSALV
jgi:hypothetical protein